MRVSSDEELLNELRRIRSRRLEFFSNPGRQKRERLAVGIFLQGLDVGFDPNDLFSPPVESKCDVEFCKARFQVKEIPDPGTRRGDEYRRMYRAAENARTVKDAYSYEPMVYDTPPTARFYDLIVEEAHKRSVSGQYKSEELRRLDLLFHLTRTRASLPRLDEVRLEDFQDLGWRSVSGVAEPSHSIVLFATPQAPQFLKKRAVVTP